MPVPLQRGFGLEWSVASRTAPGEAVCGDDHFVAASRDHALLAVVDGLGHGKEATAAASRAVAELAGTPQAPVVTLMQRCHRALRDTRGVAMTLVALDRRERALTAVGVGNVEARVVRAYPRGVPPRESILLRSGVVGFQLPALQADVIHVAVGDVVVLATDGVREDFGDELNALDPLPALVERILTRKSRGTDDALVLACRILPGE